MLKALLIVVAVASTLIALACCKVASDGFGEED